MSIEGCPDLQTNVRWPIPVDQRLNELIEQIEAGGFDATRSLLLAALVAGAPVSASKLENLIRTYRSKTAGAIVLQTKGPILVPDRAPGRRPRRSRPRSR
jgi:hypothetical protein